MPKEKPLDDVAPLWSKLGIMRGGVNGLCANVAAGDIQRVGTLVVFDAQNLQSTGCTTSICATEGTEESMSQNRPTTCKLSALIGFWPVAA
jgi:hypothetical protein